MERGARLFFLVTANECDAVYGLPRSYRARNDGWIATELSLLAMTGGLPRADVLAMTILF